jgi:hypothetical protein
VIGSCPTTTLRDDHLQVAADLDALAERYAAFDAKLGADPAKANSDKKEKDSRWSTSDSLKPSGSRRIAMRAASR